MESDSMNVSALKRADPYVKTILDTAAHVALYSFNSDSYEWERLNVEGALFICSRSSEPKHNLMILNRLNTLNLIEPITDGLDLQLKDPFLLYKNVEGKINGIWFYEREECVRIAKSLESLVSNFKKSITHSSFNVYNLVSKPPEPNNVVIKSEGRKTPEGTSKSVMDFFAKASSKTPSQPPGGYIGPPPGMPKNNRVDVVNQNKDVKPLLQRLMSNPAHSVEHIEKQQRTITPKKESKDSGLGQVNVKKEQVKQNVRQRPVSLSLGGNSQSNVENGLEFLRISDSTSPSTVTTQQFFNSNILHSHLPFVEQPIEVSELEKTVSSSAQPSCSLETPSTKVPLIPPALFESPGPRKEDGLNLSLNVKPEPLTKTQLLQAVSYLLKHDSDFVTKLHEAYVKSFVDMVS